EEPGLISSRSSTKRNGPGRDVPGRFVWAAIFRSAGAALIPRQAQDEEIGQSGSGKETAAYARLPLFVLTLSLSKGEYAALSVRDPATNDNPRVPGPPSSLAASP